MWLLLYGFHNIPSNSQQCTEEASIFCSINIFYMRISWICTIIFRSRRAQELKFSNLYISIFFFNYRYFKKFLRMLELNVAHDYVLYFMQSKISARNTRILASDDKKCKIDRKRCGTSELFFHFLFYFGNQNKIG